MRKYGEFDILRGFAIIVVVLSHTLFYHVETFPYQHFVTVFYSLGKAAGIVIPLFYFITGYYSMRSAQRRKWKFVSSRFRLLLPPYFIWSTLFITAEILFASELDMRITWTDIIQKYLLGNADTAYYFIFVLFIFYAITPLFSGMTTSQIKKLFFPSFLAMIIFSALYYIPLYHGHEIVPLLFALRNPLVWFFFYLWGMYTFKQGKMFWRKSLSTKTKLLAFFTYVAAVLELYFMPSKYQPGVPLLGPIGFMYYAAALPVFLRWGYLISLKDTLLSRILGSYGRHTLGIYLANDFINGGIMIIAISLFPILAQRSALWINFIAFLISVNLLYFMVRGVWKLNKRLYSVIF